jgi:hypothetical protein
MPSFDIALIGRDGRGVIAGRAQPGAKIILVPLHRGFDGLRGSQDWQRLGRDE